MRLQSLLALPAAALPWALGAAAAWAEAGGEGGGHAQATHGFPWLKVVFHAINLAILAAILYYAMRRPVREFLAQRSRRVRDELAAASRARLEAEELLAEFRRKLEGADQEGEALRQGLISEGEAEKKRLIDQGERQAQRLLDEAHRASERELVRAKEALRVEAVRLAAELAAVRLSKEIGETERKRYNQDFIKTLERLEP